MSMPIRRILRDTVLHSSRSPTKRSWRAIQDEVSKISRRVRINSSSARGRRGNGDLILSAFFSGKKKKICPKTSASSPPRPVITRTSRARRGSFVADRNMSQDPNGRLHVAVRAPACQYYQVIYPKLPYDSLRELRREYPTRSLTR